MKSNKIILISFVLVATLFVTGCGVLDMFTESIEATQKKVVSSVATGNIELSRDSVRKNKNIIAAEDMIDLEKVNLDKGDILMLELYSRNDAYFQLGDQEFEVKDHGPHMIKFEAEEKGVYELRCLFDCDQGDLAKELKIVVG